MGNCCGREGVPANPVSTADRSNWGPSAAVGDAAEDHPQPLFDETPPTPPFPEDRNYPVYVGKYDYNGHADDKLSFKKGDLLYVIRTDEGDWWIACSKYSNKVGYIPSNYVAERGSLDAEDYFGGSTTCSEAEKQLMMPSNSYGSFLVRESKPGNFSLSIRDRERVRHYCIKQLENGAFFVTHRITFNNIMDLVAHYRQQADGLCCNLIQPCLLSEKPRAPTVANKEWETERKQISLVKKKSEGDFGVVWEGLWDDNTPVAIKMLKPGTMPAAEFLQEANFMKKLHHAKVLQLYAVCTKEEPIYIITEFMKYGSMLEYFRGEGRTLKLSELIDLAAQVAAGMAYLEQQNCIHRSLAAQNIMVGEHKVCKIANYRQARIVNDNVYEAPTDETFPVKWTAPESAEYKRFTIKSDVWSFGIVLYEIITCGCCSPYPDMTSEQVLEPLMMGYRMPCPIVCPDKLYKIMLECWKEQPADRPTFETLQWKLEDFFMNDEVIFVTPERVCL